MCKVSTRSLRVALKLRYGISPSDVHVGASIVDQGNVEQVMQWTAAAYR